MRCKKTLESNKNQKQFWKKIGKIGVADDRRQMIPMEVLDIQGNISTDLTTVLNKWKTDFSDLLNQVSQTSTSNANIIIPDNGTFNVFLLTEPISFHETVNVINNAKKGKAAGFDN